MSGACYPWQALVVAALVVKAVIRSKTDSRNSIDEVFR